MLQLFYVNREYNVQSTPIDYTCNNLKTEATENPLVRETNRLINIPRSSSAPYSSGQKMGTE